MGHRFLELATSPAARAAQAAQGSRAAYARMEGGQALFDQLGPREAAFIAARDSFYIASVNPDGWPYVQHRGGPPGFLKVLDDRRLGFADLAGNKQYLTLGNVATEDRVALFLMDYPNRRRLKLLGRMHAVDLAADAALADRLALPEYPARIERGFVIVVEALDWNCPQHITPRFTEAELAEGLAPIRHRLEALERENEALRARLAEAG
ncbi:pyridoxamine 5'-phosphate oxidase family protein [Falsiroseomonas tokyonensis]|uniref:Pyridoxamine 5'-phosphate oxidase family protein n=1 Tax=Falsiroseomonas tokyonensis TaxID=430521 RepID=A0ABV7BV31_9PROT|nr:pyridoxamine 5'-phosphate oxidase family protein [Falsiroseomonas tokyonensis]MBU8537845.1 pyridoxamine 5'-phosphate oxidase family protein [Falsiroseomonas tokyonensis]